ncbi:MAG: hypothetical protein GC149_07165 [Gammaproteobacteria bacterium]|nr:hypothetical protein [Gammaproteobacteria bacterium]
MPETQTQRWNPQQYAAQGRFVSDLGMLVMCLDAQVMDDNTLSRCDIQGDWYADYVRLRFSATKPATAV